MPAADILRRPDEAAPMPAPPAADLNEFLNTPLALAVSGGGDSMALLHRVADLRPGRRDGLLALTVDHRLRPEAAGEARQVADHCARLGIRHRTLAWSGPKPVSGLMEAARLARYRLLADAAAGAGCAAVLTGHTRDDQIETLSMRAGRGAGRGLAGMAPATLYGGRIWFLRPLMAWRRQALRHELADRGLGWLEDPSNADPRYERVRVRGSLSPDSPDAARLLETARETGSQRILLARRAAAIVLDPSSFDPSGWPETLLFRTAGRDLPGDALAEAAAQASRLLTGHLYGPSGDARSQVASLLTGPGGVAFTAAGAVFRKTRDGVRIERDPRWRGRGGQVPELIPSFDHAVFDALARRTDLPEFPPVPIGGEV
ncbi:tRNA lysidine(34) synthetase TilS [Zhengella mangrovi]|uniref:tRNA(Ile)-lysidine synthase n=1 Tax=Zhengella mangrovi TaxID=1982044 RepID=A0A2G1QKT5_9HYPH|nr:tRNA lysidine(34) synthetase TilS [Zhengella mangrovi]PHP66143.1 tRNA lysidine(34) synthetase TilS [Zhengella mangrovi]